MADKPVAIVTGASRGIGRAVALELASLGFDIAVNRVQDQPPDVKGQIEQAGAACEFVQGDVSVAEDRRRIVDATKAAFGRCDMLVNNAGAAPLKRLDILEATEESFDRVMGINLKGPYFLTQLVANWMIEQKRRHPQRDFRIVNIGSVSAYASSPFRGEYCVSKAGMTMMTRLYADRLAEFGIGVYEISPGVIETDMTSAVKEKYDKLISEGFTPIRRWGQPEDVAKAVAAIAEGRFDFSTGIVLDVDGGFHMHRL
jgi:NAD(P)-dependent dehydrogenase (short-subunit alcohol dehydrogenase family)